MREIKFRAWDWEKMVQLPIIGLQHEHEANPCIYKYKAGDESSEELLYYSDSMPMQYTWLKDKNGKEIYEGDIIEYCYIDPMGWMHEDTHGFNDIVEYRNWMFWHQQKRKFTPLEDNIKKSQGEYIPNCWNKVVYWDFIWKVIGNIYENPELITKTTNEQ